MGKGRQTTWGIRPDDLGFKRRYFNIGKKDSSLGFNEKTNGVIVDIDETVFTDIKESARMRLWRELKNILKPVKDSRDLCVFNLTPIRCHKGGGRQGRLEYHAIVDGKPTDAQYEAIQNFIDINFKKGYSVSE